MPLATLASRLRNPDVASLQRDVQRLRRRVKRLEESQRTATAESAPPDPAPAAPAVGAEPSSHKPELTAVAEIPGKSRLDLRRECVLSAVVSDPRILEIGPAHNAILPKRDGFDTRIVDYLDRAGLVDKYKEFTQYDPNDIEEVDYVLEPGADMAASTGTTFDLVVASHVLEHTTSLIDFLNECSKLLHDDGVLALVVPDHRFCFDRFRERSGLARIIDASVNPPAVHTMGTLIEERINVSKHRGTTSWAPRHRGDYELVFTPSQAMDRGRLAGGTYIDAHNWVFTPNYLRLVVQDLHSLGFTDLQETYFHDTVRNEFFLNLSRKGQGTGRRREELLTLADAERRSLDVPTWTE